VRSPAAQPHSHRLGTFWGNYFAAYHSAFGRGTVYPGESYVVLWSLCVEEHFYLLWPGFLAVMKRLRTRVLVAAGVCLALAGLRYLTRVLDSQHVEGLQQLSAASSSMARCDPQPRSTSS